MPYLRCPNCGLLAHVLAADPSTVVHCPRCRALPRQIELAPLEESLRSLSATPADPEPRID
jgi:uncharacterized paraquat-inducible protein A